MSRTHITTCGFCGMQGHTKPTCHVRARSAIEPDDADRQAQDALPADAYRQAGDVRYLIAALIRSGGRLP